MFSGIIQEITTPISVRSTKDGKRLTLPIPKSWKLTEGESISLDGVCATIEKLDKKSFSVFLMPETLDKSTLGSLDKNHVFNLERCLTLNTLIGGHLVQGHVDTKARVASIKTERESRILTFKIDKKFIRYMVYKGSITVNGVSLTIVSVNSSTFTVSLIPYTISHTNLGSVEIGDSVNIEVDMMAKYVEKLLKK